MKNQNMKTVYRGALGAQEVLRMLVLGDDVLRRVLVLSILFGVCERFDEYCFLFFFLFGDRGDRHHGQIRIEGV